VECCGMEVAEPASLSCRKISTYVRYPKIGFGRRSFPFALLRVRISAGGTDAAKAPQVRFQPAPPLFLKDGNPGYCCHELALAEVTSLA
jgi:hypothetical protein